MDGPGKIVQGQSISKAKTWFGQARKAPEGGFQVGEYGAILLNSSTINIRSIDISLTEFKSWTPFTFPQVPAILWF